MGTTTPRGLPAPSASDPDAVPADLLALVQTLDPSLTGSDVRVMLLQDGAAAPSGSAVRGVFWLNTATGAFYGPVGGAWTLLNPPSPTGGVTPSASAPGDSGAAGSSATAAAADHKHAREGYGSPGSSAPGDGGSTGTAGTLARSDHQHGREAWGQTADIQTVVLAGAPSGGISTKVARADHAHGLTQTPAPLGLGAAGPLTARTDNIEIITPRPVSITGYQARIAAGSGTTVQLLVDGTAVTGSMSGGLSQTVSTVAFAAVAVTRGHRIGLQIVAGGSGASDVSVMLDAVFTG